jgi:hypothetical protein
VRFATVLRMISFIYSYQNNAYVKVSQAELLEEKIFFDKSGGSG